MPASDGSTSKEAQNGSSSSSSAPPPGTVESELAKALQELARGEEAATTLENDLSRLEQKLDEILAAFEERDAASAATAESQPNPEAGSGLKANPTNPPAKDGGDAKEDR